jgi:hypothetical protein
MNIIHKDRLSNSEYERPEKTLTELIQNKADIEKQLENFEEIDNEDLCYVNLNTQLKYLSFDVKKKRELFRFGGLLVKVNKEYVVLAGKEGKTFSVQRYTKNTNGQIVHTTRFFKKIKEADILKVKYEEEMSKVSEILHKQNEIIKKQKEELGYKKKTSSK